MRTIVAGRYRKVARYTRALPGDSSPVRVAKAVATNGAQRYINIKNATEKLQWLLCANFDRRDACFVTCTFRDGSLPPTRAKAKELVSHLRQNLYRQWKRQGRALQSIYVVEGEGWRDLRQADDLWEVMPWRDKTRWEGLDTEAPPEETKPDEPIRLHAHLFLHLRREDYETVRSLWPWGHVYINPMKVNDLATFRRLAAYVTKEARMGKLPPGQRSYIPSQNLEQPKIEGHWCSEFEGIAIPPEADEIQRGGESNREFGASLEYVFYRMPRPSPPPMPYRSRGRIETDRPAGRKQQKLPRG